MKNLSWFTKTECTELTITKYKSLADETVIASITIKDPTAIKYFVSKIQSLPVNGDEMISHGPKSQKMNLNFTCADQSFQSIDFINRQIKTPSTGFYSEKNKTESDLYRDLDGLVEPDLNKRIFKIKNQQIKFKNFTIIFTGQIHTPQPEGGPTVGPTNNAHYDLFEKDSPNKVSIDIFDGQTPPQPKSFVVGKKIYQLLTFQNVAKERLYPGYFEVSEDVPKR